jgi:hypothetical protein
MNTRALFYLALASMTALLPACKSNSDELELIPFKNGEDWGYINWDGEIIINPQFTAAGYFFDGRASVINSNGLYGYIDDEGKYVISAQFDQASRFSDGVAWTVKEGNFPAAIDPSGDLVYTCENCYQVQNYSEGLAAFSTKDKGGEIRWGYRDLKGKIVITPQFHEAYPMHQGRAQVKNKEGKIGLIDKDGKLVVSYQFHKGVLGFNEQGIGIAGDKEHFGLIDLNGKYQVNPQFDALFFGPNNTFIAYDGDRWGLIDAAGKYLFNPQFKFVFPTFSANTALHSKELIPVQQGDDWGYANSEGKLIINPQFDQALPFHNSRAFVKSSDQWGVIDSEGKYQVNPQFAEVMAVAHGNGIIGVDLNFNSVDVITSRYVETRELEKAFRPFAQWLKQEFSINTVLKATSVSIEDYTGGRNSYYFPNYRELYYQEFSPNAYLRIRVNTEGTTELVERRENVGWYTEINTYRNLLPTKRPVRTEMEMWLYGDYYQNARFILTKIAPALGFSNEDAQTDDAGRINAYVRKKNGRVWYFYYRDNSLRLETGDVAYIQLPDDSESETVEAVVDTVVEADEYDYESEAALEGEEAAAE